MNVVCLVIDRLQAGYVGAYGNTWIETPNLDRLASQSFLLEHALKKPFFGWGGWARNRVYDTVTRGEITTATDGYCTACPPES